MVSSTASKEEQEEAQEEHEVVKTVWLEKLKLHASRTEQLIENK